MTETKKLKSAYIQSTDLAGPFPAAFQSEAACSLFWNGASNVEKLAVLLLLLDADPARSIFFFSSVLLSSLELSDTQVYEPYGRSIPSPCRFRAKRQHLDRLPLAGSGRSGWRSTSRSSRANTSPPSRIPPHPSSSSSLLLSSLELSDTHSL